MDLSEQSERMQSFYGLRHDPFGAIVDAMVFSGAGGRYETAETIRHLLTYSHQDSLLVGTPGSGKRTLAQQVIKMVDEQWRIAWVDGTEIENSTDLMREIVGQLGLGIKVDAASEELISQIISIVSTRVQDEESFLIVVQFADRVPAIAMDALLALREQCENLDDRVRQLWLTDSVDIVLPSVNEDDWYIHSLEPFTDDDASQYLKDRMVAAGLVNDLPITSKDVSRLNQIADGLSSQLNEVARDYLISSTFKTTEKKQAFPITHVFAGLAALCLVVIAFLYKANEPKSETQVAVTDKPATEMTSVEKRLAEAVAKVEAKQQETTNATGEETDTASEYLASSTPENTPAPSNNELVPTTTSNGAVDMTDREDETTVSADKSETLLSRGGENEYTMQLIGVRDRSKLDTLMSEFSNTDLVDVIETTHEGKPWFVLIYGQYPSKAEAQQDIASLPDSLKASEPWIRTFGSLRN